MPRAYKALPPASELWERFDYKPLTGELVRKSTGKAATRPNSAGYITTMCNQHIFQTHRLVFSWCGGNCTNKIVHHIDANRTNNRFWNLQAVTDCENARTAGGKGWKLTKNGKRYEARITSNYSYKHLGTYDTEAEARAVSWCVCNSPHCIC